MELTGSPRCLNGSVGVLSVSLKREQQSGGFIHLLFFIEGQNKVHVSLSWFMPGVRGLVGLSQLSR